MTTPGWVANTQLALFCQITSPRPLWRAGWQPLAVILCNSHLPPTPLAFLSCYFRVLISPYDWEFKGQFWGTAAAVTDYPIQEAIALHLLVMWP